MITNRTHDLASGSGDVFVYSRNGQAHFLCYCLHGFTVHAAQNKCSAALYRQRVDDGFQAAQLVAGLELALGRNVVGDQVEIGNHFVRDDFRAPCLVDDQVARDGEQIAASVGDAGEVVHRESPGHRFRYRVVDFVRIRHDPA